MKEEIYQTYSVDDPVIFAREQAMEESMPTAEKMYQDFSEMKLRLKKGYPDSAAAKNPLNVDLRCLQAARMIWQSARNGAVGTNDASHPNNWTKHHLMKMAGVIQSTFGIPMYK